MKQTVLVLYHSKTGFTERYARWLAEEIPCELVPYAQRAGVRFEDYSAVVFGGWFHAGNIMGFSWFKEKLPQLAGKTMAVFATGATPADTPEAKQALAHNTVESGGKALPLFYLPSGLNYEKMGRGDRFLMSIFRKMIKKTQGESSEMYKALCQSYDIATKQALAPLVQYLRERL